MQHLGRSWPVHSPNQLILSLWSLVTCLLKHMCPYVQDVEKNVYQTRLLTVWLTSFIFHFPHVMSCPLSFVLTLTGLSRINIAEPSHFQFIAMQQHRSWTLQEKFINFLASRADLCFILARAWPQDQWHNAAAREVNQTSWQEAESHWRLNISLVNEN